MSEPESFEAEAIAGLLGFGAGSMGALVYGLAEQGASWSYNQHQPYFNYLQSVEFAVDVGAGAALGLVLAGVVAAVKSLNNT